MYFLYDWSVFKLLTVGGGGGEAAVDPHHTTSKKHLLYPFLVSPFNEIEDHPALIVY
jgi:hypothetical protein